MTAKERRNELSNILAAAKEPLSAGALAQRLNVSRQVIVGDVALMRAMGANIIATPRGYLVTLKQRGKAHNRLLPFGCDLMEAELNALVDAGCTVLDVIVDHPLYGQLTGQLSLSSRYDVEQFRQRMEESGASPCRADGGDSPAHNHCPSEAAFARVKKKLRELEFCWSRRLILMEYNSQFWEAIDRLVAGAK
jgi:transcriptional regulator of NAD metabolism